MKHGQTTVIAQESAVAAWRAGAWTCIFVGAMLLPLPLDAAIDRNDDVLWSGAEATGGNFPYIAPDWSDQLAEAGNAVVPPVKREAPKTPAVPPDQAAPIPDAGAGSAAKSTEPAKEGGQEEPSPAPQEMTDRIQEWLARANREFQATVIRRLSTPPVGGASDDEIARKLQEVKEQDAKAAAAKRAEDERKAAEAKRAEEEKRQAAEAKHLEDERLAAENARQKAAEEAKAKQAQPEPQPAAKPDDTARLAEEMRRERARLEEEADRIEAQRKAAEVKRIADERAADEARVAEERQRAAAAENEKNARRSIVLTPEPIPRPEPQSTTVRREPSPPESGSDSKPSSEAAPPRSSEYREASNNLTHGPAVKRWVWRARDSRCQSAGRRIVPPGRYTVRRGDSLWLIAKLHYRRGWLYRKIYRANRSIIRDPDLIYPCQRILVPRAG
jgi:colicin import membrane protein